MAKLSTQERLALADELHTAVGLVRAGCDTLRGVATERDLYHLPLLLLAGGLERLFKATLWLDRWHRTGRGLSVGELRGLGHDLERLLEDILEHCFTEAHRDRAITREDFAFLRQNDLFRLLLRTLSEFASRQGRYHNLNLLGGEPLTYRDPRETWKRLERLVLARNPGLVELLDEGSIEEGYEGINAEFVASLEWGVRAIARLYILGRFEHEGAMVAGDLWDFAALLDNQLGEAR